MAQLQTGNPYNIELVYNADIQDAASVEKKVHVEFSSFNTRGEWLELDDINLEKVIAYMSLHKRYMDVNNNEKELITKHFPNGLYQRKTLPAQKTAIEIIATFFRMTINNLFVSALNRKDVPSTVDALTFEEAVEIIKYGNSLRLLAK
jgi:hypothetical protein